MILIYCPECGEETNSNDNYCKNYGSELIETNNDKKLESQKEVNFEEINSNKTVQNNSKTNNETSCPNCGTNDVKYYDPWGFVLIVFMVLNISFGLMITGYSGITAIGVFSFFITIPIAIYFILFAIAAFVAKNNFKCNNCGNRFEIAKKEKENKNSALSFALISIFIFMIVFIKFWDGF